jgi:hypothetical protein
MSVRIATSCSHKQCKEEDEAKYAQASVLQETLNYSHMSLSFCSEEYVIWYYIYLLFVTALEPNDTRKCKVYRVFRHVLY